MYCENFLELYASMKLKIESSQLETEKIPVKKLKIIHKFHLELSTLLTRNQEAFGTEDERSRSVF